MLSSMNRSLEPSEGFGKRRHDEMDNMERNLMEEGRDRFCWKCHIAISGDDSYVPCNSCIKNFHRKCYASLKIAKIDEFECCECLAIKKKLLKRSSDPSESEKQTLKSSLLHILNQLGKYRVQIRNANPKRIEEMSSTFWSAAFLKNVEEFKELIVYPMDYGTLKKNVDRKKYKIVEEVLSDAAWIHHNCYILHSDEMPTIADRMYKRLLLLLKDAACLECYYKSVIGNVNLVTSVCEKPHMILWGISTRYPAWPCKVISIKQGFNEPAVVKVVYFGSHDKRYVTLDKCYLYSKSVPLMSRDYKLKKNVAIARAAGFKEAREYIKQLETKFKILFIYPPENTQFDPINILEQWRLMIPQFPVHCLDENQRLLEDPDDFDSDDNSYSGSEDMFGDGSESSVGSETGSWSENGDNNEEENSATDLGFPRFRFGGAGESFPNDEISEDEGNDETAGTSNSESNETINDDSNDTINDESNDTINDESNETINDESNEMINDELSAYVGFGNEYENDLDLNLGSPRVVRLQSELQKAKEANTTNLDTIKWLTSQWNEAQNDLEEKEKELEECKAAAEVNETKANKITKEVEDLRSSNAFLLKEMEENKGRFKCTVEMYNEIMLEAKKKSDESLANYRSECEELRKEKLEMEKALKEKTDKIEHLKEINDSLVFEITVKEYGPPSSDLPNIEELDDQPNDVSDDE